MGGNVNVVRRSRYHGYYSTTRRLTVSVPLICFRVQVFLNVIYYRRIQRSVSIVYDDYANRTASVVSVIFVPAHIYKDFSDLNAVVFIESVHYPTFVIVNVSACIWVFCLIKHSCPGSV